MKDKQIGVIFILISTLMYLTYFVTSAWYAAKITGWKINLGKMGTAMKEFGYTPLVLAFLALGLGIFYIIRAEIRELKSNKDES